MFRRRREHATALSEIVGTDRDVLVPYPETHRRKKCTFLPNLATMFCQTALVFEGAEILLQDRDILLLQDASLREFRLQRHTCL